VKVRVHGRGGGRAAARTSDRVVGDLFHSQRVAERRNLRGEAAATASVVQRHAAPRDGVGFVVREAGTAPRAAGAGAELKQTRVGRFVCRGGLTLRMPRAAAAVSPPLLRGEREREREMRKINELDW